MRKDDRGCLSFSSTLSGLTPQLVHTASLNMVCTPNYSLITKSDFTVILPHDGIAFIHSRVAQVWPMYCIVP